MYTKYPVRALPLNTCNDNDLSFNFMNGIIESASWFFDQTPSALI